MRTQPRPTSTAARLRRRALGLLPLTVCLLFACDSKESGSAEGAGFDSGLSSSSGEGGSATEGGNGDDGGDATSASSTSGGFTAFDAGNGTGEPPPPPEEEDEGDFRVPQASGRYVYAANETTDRVAVINAETLTIEVVSVSRGPTWVQPIPGQAADVGAVLVLSPESDEATFVRTTSSGANSVELRGVAEGANALAPSPDGAFVIAYNDADLPAAPVGSVQEITVLDTAEDGPSYALSVGPHPRAVRFAPDSSRAYIITDAGVDVVNLDDIENVTKPQFVDVLADEATDPATLEIQVSAATGQALSRVDEETTIVVTDLASGAQTLLDLPGFPTDVDVSKDGSFALAVLPSKNGSSLVEIPLPVASESDFSVVSLGDEYVGVAQLSDQGDTALLYTTVDPWDLDGEVAPNGDPRARMSVVHRNGGAWDGQQTVFTEIPIRSAGISPDSNNALLLHAIAPELNAAAPWPYTLVDLAAAVPLRKVHQVKAKPQSVLFTPDGTRAAVSIRDDEGTVRQVDLIKLSNFIVDSLVLGSPPQGLGHVEPTDKIFISQEHASGRITFVSADGTVQTATGFELNDGVKD